jgi:hypothetical protein
MSAVGIDAAIRPVGVAADGQMQLPPDPRVLGWYRFGAAPERADPRFRRPGRAPGLPRYGLGPLVRLREVETGDLVEVTSSDRLLGDLPGGGHHSLRPGGLSR